MGLTRASILAACTFAVACSGTKPRPVEDARSGSAVRGDADAAVTPGSGSPDAGAAPAGPATGDAQIRVEWRDVPVPMRASPGKTACNTARAPAIAPTTTWGVPDVLVIVEGMPADAVSIPATRIVLADCAFTPRLAAAAALVVESAVDRPSQFQVARRGAITSLDKLEPGTPRAVQLPIAGHGVAIPLEPGGVYELATDAKQPETAWIIAAPAAITEASGAVIVKDLPPGAHAVTAWLPPRSGATARIARGTITVVAGDLAELTLDLAKP
ncbi:MAG: hypothetical protein M3619_20340 [Myxococcota bacterium]|nr:hypothetical protein [Myxococcota bacterium]